MYWKVLTHDVTTIFSIITFYYLNHSFAHLFSSAGADLWYFCTILYLPNSMDGRVSFSPLAAILKKLKQGIRRDSSIEKEMA